MLLEYISTTILLNPSLYLAYGQGKNIGFIQTAYYIPSAWLSFIIICINFVFYYALTAKKKKSIKRIKLAILFLMIICVIGYIRLTSPNPKSITQLPILAIHAKHKQKLKLDPSFARQQFNDYLNLSKKGLELNKNNKIKAKLLIWPETAIQEYILYHPELINQLNVLSHTYQISILLGTKHHHNNAYLNGAVLLKPMQKMMYSTQFISKHILMPFGEYWPLIFFKKYYTKYFSPYGFTVVKSNSLIKISSKKTNLATLICMDAAFPNLFKSYKQKGASAFLVLANMAWFEGSFLSERLLRMCQLRAIENKRALFLLSNHGTSAIFDPFGKIMFKSINRFYQFEALPIWEN
eukprot:COSAG01_NODE_519_length_16012_cov_4.344058_9_plen_351_part_00